MTILRENNILSVSIFNLRKEIVEYVMSGQFWSNYLIRYSFQHQVVKQVPFPFQFIQWSFKSFEYSIFVLFCPEILDLIHLNLIECQKEIWYTSKFSYTKHSADYILKCFLQLKTSEAYFIYIFVNSREVSCVHFSKSPSERELPSTRRELESPFLETFWTRDSGSHSILNSRVVKCASPPGRVD